MVPHTDLMVSAAAVLSPLLLTHVDPTGKDSFPSNVVQMLISTDVINLFFRLFRTWMRVFHHILDVDIFSEDHKLGATLIQQEALPPDMIVCGGTILYKLVMPNCVGTLL